MRDRLFVAAALAIAMAAFAPMAAHAADMPDCVETTPVQLPLEYKSVEFAPDGRATFRLCAPQAAQARVVSSDIAAIPNGYDGAPAGLPMTKDARGYWTVTTATAVAPGPYRYAFKVDGVQLADPQGRNFSEHARGVVSVLDVPGAEAAFESFRADVPHGLVATLDYQSTSLGVPRRAHVYTPPGYESGLGRHYPVLYLLHGSGDSDDSWTSIGHAQYILDNLIAAGKARPMIVVMPFAHTGEAHGPARMNNVAFGKDLLTDLVPYIDAHFRTAPSAAHRAMAGLSMGGAHTFQFGLPHPDVFGTIGLFSVGLSPEQIQVFVTEHGPGLADRAKSPGLVWYAIGRDDIFAKTVAPTRALLDQYQVHYVFHESPGGHTWQNWRDYLTLFAPMLFRAG